MAEYMRDGLQPEDMAGASGPGSLPGIVRRVRESTHPAVMLARDIAWVVAVVGAIALILFLVSGTWPAVVAIESESMVPNMQVGDLVFVVAPDRFGDLQTWAEGEKSGYAPFATNPDRQGTIPYGDVIIYRPNGDTRVHPIIHRAIGYVDGTEGAGYITKGDNNQGIDQNTYYPGIGTIQPVRKEWVIGKALFSIPLVGYLPLNIIPFAALILILVILHELLSRRGGDGYLKKPEAGKKGKRK
jgi:signal peptidase